ncbi:hypothetical protein AKO1_007718 [Acrasis kona]|uniref:PX domain-containing protein n=1 Tax=Acrasis kona TaxID=1008807 RepID=A0AAW2YRN4_9EUKA
MVDNQKINETEGMTPKELVTSDASKEHYQGDVILDMMDQNAEEDTRIFQYEAEVVGSQERNDEFIKFTMYEIKVSNKLNQREYFVFRRYSEFSVLRQELQLKYPEILTGVAFPTASWFDSISQRTDLDARKEGLNLFLKYLLRHPKISQETIVLNFIKYDMQMLQKALSHFRTRLYNLRQLKTIPQDKEPELEKSQQFLKALSKTLEEEAGNKVKDFKLPSTPLDDENFIDNQRPRARSSGTRRLSRGRKLSEPEPVETPQEV